MSEKHVLGDLQLAIMRVLWAAGEATVNDVHRALLTDRGLAPTTIATMLKKMEAKGVVAHRTEGRQFVYQPTITEPDVRSSMVGELVNRVFQGDAAELVNHLLETKGIDADELAALKAKIDAAEEREA